MEKIIKFFASHEDAERAEIKRRESMSFQERLNEFAVIQQRAFGEKWTGTPIKKVVSYELLEWKN